MAQFYTLVRAFNTPTDYSSVPAQGYGLAVKLDSSGTTTGTARRVVTCGAGQASLGAIINHPAAGQTAEVLQQGITRVVAGAAFSINAELASDSAGKYVAAASGDRIIAVANESASGADVMAEVELVRGSIKP